jgi:hypothetical protein
MEIFQKILLNPFFSPQKCGKKHEKNMGLFQASSCPLIEFLHPGLVDACFVGKAREGIQSRCIGIEDGKVRRGNAVALGR